MNYNSYFSITGTIVRINSVNKKGQMNITLKVISDEEDPTRKYGKKVEFITVRLSEIQANKFKRVAIKGEPITVFGSVKQWRKDDDDIIFVNQAVLMTYHRFEMPKEILNFGAIKALQGNLYREYVQKNGYTELDKDLNFDIDDLTDNGVPF